MPTIKIYFKRAPFYNALVRVGTPIRENDRAMEYLEKSYEEHSHWLIYLHMDPSMDDLRNDSRFQELVRRVGLPAPPPTTPAEKIRIE
jgi:hypothetical protein